ncbi:hypothetical protein Clacol_000545 [Clathrus columnatus]|uniref:C2H2-type domain-containing protein n=1 Tax=Clathrus columnatus TaxID=1419009 RepID=A0AAV5A0W1_9AGAM|nr:hypothetical protein Clacol_000545 [Clathrus columnatus]
MDLISFFSKKVGGTRSGPSPGYSSSSIPYGNGQNYASNTYAPGMSYIPGNSSLYNVGYPAAPSQPQPIPYSPQQYNPQYDTEQSSPSLSPSSPQQAYYPASPTRPYPCDMCALSFDRSHDLKRHR